MEATPALTNSRFMSGFLHKVHNEAGWAPRSSTTFISLSQGYWSLPKTQTPEESKRLYKAKPVMRANAWIRTTNCWVSYNPTLLKQLPNCQIPWCPNHGLQCSFPGFTPGTGIFDVSSLRTLGRRQKYIQSTWWNKWKLFMVRTKGLWDDLVEAVEVLKGLGEQRGTQLQLADLSV